MRVLHRLVPALTLLTFTSCMADIKVKTIEPLNLENWSVIRAATGKAPKQIFLQSWQEQPSENLSPGYVKVTREKNGLVVYAHLKDTDIYNENKTFNAPFFMDGDVFEIFLRPEGQDAYFELHIGPENQQMQLKIDHTDKFYERRKTYPPVEEMIAPYRIAKPGFESRTHVDAKAGTWEVAVRISYAFLSDGVTVDDTTVLHANFSRYDYSKTAKEPVYSATAKLTKLDFHRQADWDRLLP